RAPLRMDAVTTIPRRGCAAPKIRAALQTAVANRVLDPRRLRGLFQRDAVDLDEQLARSTQKRALSIRRRIDDEPRPVESLDEVRQCDLGFDTRERRAEAVMNAAAEPQVGIVFALWIELVGIAEPRGIPAARCEHERDEDPLRNRNSCDPCVLERRP